MTDKPSDLIGRMAIRCDLGPLLPWQRDLVDRLFDLDEDTGALTPRPIDLLPPRTY